MNFHDLCYFPYDFPGLENGLPKFHDFPWPGCTLFNTVCASDVKISAPVNVQNDDLERNGSKTAPTAIFKYSRIPTYFPSASINPNLSSGRWVGQMYIKNARY